MDFLGSFFGRDELREYQDKLTKFAIPQEQFDQLESLKYQLEPNQIERKKKEIISVIETIGIEKLGSVFESAFNEIVAPGNKGSRTFQNNKKIFSTIFRAAKFVGKSDKSLYDKCSTVMVNHYSDFLAQYSTQLDEKTMVKVKDWLVGETSGEICHPESKSFDDQTVIIEVKRGLNLPEIEDKPSSQRSLKP